MSFTISSAVNPPTVFLARLSELAKRLDPEFVLFRRKVHQFKFPVQTLRRLFSEPPQYGAGERGIERTSADQPRYVRITDIDEYGVLNDDIGVTAETVQQRYILEEDDLLLARSGNTVGKSYLHKQRYAPCQCFYAGYLIRFRFDHSRVLPDYVFALTQLPYYRAWVDAIQRAAGQPNINAQEYSHLEIPIPPPPVQARIVALIGEAYAEKRRRDAEAKRLLETIDDILLAELDIPQSTEPPSTIQSRMFRRVLSEVSGGRLDPHFHRPEFEKLAEQLQKYRHSTMRSVAQLSSEQWDQKSHFQEVFPYVEIGSVDLAFGKLAPPPLVPIAEAASRAKMLVRPGDLLISLTRPTRRAICFVPDDLALAVASNGFCVVRHIKDPGVDRKYLFHVLRSRLCTSQFDQRSSGGNYPAITEEEILKIVIPLPKPDEQKRIAKSLDAQYARAEKLFSEARLDLDQAKRNIEALILGKDDAK